MPQNSDREMWHTISELWHTTPSVVIASIALLISVASLAVSALNLGWNIYKEFMQGGRMRVTLMNAAMILRPDAPHPKRLNISITNFGPKKTRASMLHLRKTSWWRKILRCEKYAALIHDYEDILSAKLPAELEVGQKLDLTFRYGPNLFLNEDFNQIGIIDPFGRIHWCIRSNYRKVREQYLKKKAEYDSEKA